MPERNEPILNPEYWRGRLTKAKSQNELHRAIYQCVEDTWLQVEERHKIILKEFIGQHDSILDAGCGWGRLLTLLPEGWNGNYFGIDISPDFIQMARDNYKKHNFYVGDMRDMPYLYNRSFDWAVMISIKPMVRANLGGEVWDEMELELRRVAKKLLFLEYNVDDVPEVVKC